MSGLILRGGRLSSETLELSYVDNVYSTGQNITGPASIQAGDIVLHSQFRYWTIAAPAVVIPIGFTELSAIANGLTRTWVSYKIADGSEASATIAGAGPYNSSHNHLLVIRPSRAPNGVVTDGFAPTAGAMPQTAIPAGSHPAPSVSMAFMYHYAQSGVVFTPISGNTPYTGNSSNIYWAIQNENPVDVQVDNDPSPSSTHGEVISVY